MCLEMAHTLVIKGIQNQVFPANSSRFINPWGFDGKAKAIIINFMQTHVRPTSYSINKKQRAQPTVIKEIRKRMEEFHKKSCCFSKKTSCS
jgi:hypothetical protein